MQIKLPFNTSKPILGEASVEIDKPDQDTFSFVANEFFLNYPKWAVEVIELQPLDSNGIYVGAKGKQVREDNGQVVESVFEITEYNPFIKFALKGLTSPYQQTYITEGLEQNQRTKLTFIFEILDVDIFMRPFEKLIRIAIEDGAESVVENIKNLMTAEC